jgi:hypothetical protein
MLTLLTYESIGNLNEPPQYSIMFERQERVAILLLLGVACAVITAHLILGTLGKQPFARPFTNNSAEGELVLTLQKGDSIFVYGVVQTYRGKKEIVVSSGKDISFIPVYTSNFSPV